MLSAGEVFAGRYRILEHLAQGGMGIIYAAEHLATEEQVALKVLWPQVLGSRAAVESFQLEAKLANRVGSEHVVRVLDAGLDERTGMPFLAMELLRGATLRALVTKQGALSAPQTIVIARQAAKALDKAHGYVGRDGRVAPIVHRDLKPENVFVALREGAAMVKVLDFGIAKVMSETTELSQEVRGTPLFMAYEQFTKGPITPRIDVWALGLIVFYLLTGRKYWLASAQGAAGFAPLLSEILTLPFAPPSERAPALGFTANLPAAFDEWFLQCVNRRPEARFASAGAAAAALESALTFGAKLSKSDVVTARAELTRRVSLLLGPSPAPEASIESTSLSLEDSAMSVASGEVMSGSPRSVGASWADPTAPAPPRSVGGSWPEATSPARSVGDSWPQAPGPARSVGDSWPQAPGPARSVGDSWPQAPGPARPSVGSLPEASGSARPAVGSRPEASGSARPAVGSWPEASGSARPSVPVPAPAPSWPVAPTPSSWVDGPTPRPWGDGNGPTPRPWDGNGPTPRPWEGHTPPHARPEGPRASSRPDVSAPPRVLTPMPSSAPAAMGAPASWHEATPAPSFASGSPGREPLPSFASGPSDAPAPLSALAKTALGEPPPPKAFEPASSPTGASGTLPFGTVSSSAPSEPSTSRPFFLRTSWLFATIAVSASVATFGVLNLWGGKSSGRVDPSSNASLSASPSAKATPANAPPPAPPATKAEAPAVEAPPVAAPAEPSASAIAPPPPAAAAGRAADPRADAADAKKALPREVSPNRPSAAPAEKPDAKKPDAKKPDAKKPDGASAPAPRAPQDPAAPDPPPTKSMYERR